MKKKLMIDTLFEYCNSHPFCLNCAFYKSRCCRDFLNLSKKELKKMLKIADLEVPKTSKEDKLIKQLEKIKEHCHKYFHKPSDNDEEFCQGCKYDVFCCKVPIEWDMDKIKERLKNDNIVQVLKMGRRF